MNRRVAKSLLWMTVIAEAVSLAALTMFFVANTIRVDLSYLTVRPHFAFWNRAESASFDLFLWTAGFVMVPLFLVLSGVRIAHAFSKDRSALYAGASAKVAVGVVIVAMLLIGFLLLCGSLAGLSGGMIG